MLIVWDWLRGYKLLSYSALFNIDSRVSDEVTPRPQFEVTQKNLDSLKYSIFLQKHIILTTMLTTYLTKQNIPLSNWNTGSCPAINPVAKIQTDNVHPF